MDKKSKHNKKPSYVNGISATFLKLVGSSSWGILSNMFNESFAQGIFPRSNETGHGHRDFQTGYDKIQAKISISPIFNKIFKKLMLTRL